jgi:hypothetical protein
VPRGSTTIGREETASWAPTWVPIREPGITCIRCTVVKLRAPTKFQARKSICRVSKAPRIER